jgi:hypothetical protein
MTYTEIRNDKYYYRVKSIRIGNKVSKKREYLGANLSKDELILKEKEADYNLIMTDELKNITGTIRDILLKNNVRKAGLFGSYAKESKKRAAIWTLSSNFQKVWDSEFLKLKNN